MTLVVEASVLARDQDIGLDASSEPEFKCGLELRQPKSRLRLILGYKELSQASRIR